MVGNVPVSARTPVDPEAIMEVELGDLAKDEITGFEGIVVAVTHWLTNCDRYTLQPQKLDKDGLPIAVQSFDEPHVRLVKSQKIKVKTYTGGPMPSPARASTPRR